MAVGGTRTKSTAVFAGWHLFLTPFLSCTYKYDREKSDAPRDGPEGKAGPTVSEVLHKIRQGTCAALEPHIV